MILTAQKLKLQFSSDASQATLWQVFVVILHPASAFMKEKLAMSSLF